MRHPGWDESREAWEELDRKHNAVIKVVEDGEQYSAISLLHDYVKASENKIREHNTLYYANDKFNCDELIIDKHEYEVYAKACELLKVKQVTPMGW